MIRYVIDNLINGKRYLLLTAVLCMFVSARAQNAQVPVAAGGSGINPVIEVHAILGQLSQCAGSQSCTFAFPNSPTGGNTLVVIAGTNHGAALSISNSSGFGCPSKWNPVDSWTAADGNANIYAWTGTAAMSAACTVKFSGADFSVWNMMGGEYSNLATPAVYAHAAGGSNSATNLTVTAGDATSVAGDFGILGWVSNNASGSAAAPGWTSEFNRYYQGAMSRSNIAKGTTVSFSGTGFNTSGGAAEVGGIMIVLKAPRVTTPLNWVRWILDSAIILLAVLAVVFTARRFRSSGSRDYAVWKPLVDTQQAVTVCIFDADPPSDAIGAPDWQDVANMIAKGEVSAVPAQRRSNPLTDAEIAQKIATWLATHGARTVSKGSSEINLQDFRQGPVVLIGGFNPWSLILLSNLRFSIQVDPGRHDEWIQDAQNLSRRDWSSNGGTQRSSVDYGIITRVLDRETGHWILAFGGLRKYGTQAASDLLVDTKYVKLLPANLKPMGNFQIVLKTNVINGNAGSPKILAIYTW